MKSRSATIGQWFRPLWFGTFVGAWSFATFSALTDGRAEWLPYAGVLKWLLFMTLFSLVGTVQAVIMGVVDTLLLWMKLRELPSGPRAWGSAIAAPVAVGFALKMWPSVHLHFGSIGLYLLSTLVPMLIVAFAFRLFFGKRPNA